MKKRSVMIIVSAVLIAAAVMPVSAQLKIGYVDTQLIMSQYKPALDAQKKLETAQKSAADESQRMQEDIISKQKRLEQQSLLLSDEKKREQSQELQVLYQQWQEFGMRKEQELSDLQNELMKPIIESINEAIQAVGKEEGCDYVLEAVNLLYANEKHELTKQVQTKLGQTVKE
ncbi:OmpH family outer membrane protein [bacterium]|nr:OmpH family outer membrane protein [bacterium]